MKLLALLLAALSAAEVVPSPTRQAAALRRQGTALLRQGHYQEAADPYRKAALLRSADPALLKDLMWTLWRAHDLDGAIEAASRALLKKKDDLEALNLRALAQLTAGRAEDAFVSYIDLDARMPGQAHVQRALAILYERYKDYPKALAYAAAALAEKPENAILHAQQARLLFLLGRVEEAAASWRNAVDLSPDSVEYRFQLARVRYALGEHDAAARAATELVAVRPRYGPALEFLFQIAVVNNRLDWAVPVFERILDEGRPEDEALVLMLAKLYETMGRPDDVLRTLDRALLLNPENGAAVRAKADFMDNFGTPAQTVAAYERLLQLNETSAPSWERYAEALRTDGQPQRALAAMIEARSLDPNNPELLIGHSRIMYEAGQEEASRTMLTRWLDSNEEKVLPVLLYHGLAARDDDPMLAALVHIPVAAFRGHMKALHDAGFTPVTAAQAAAWYHGQGGLPPRPVLITFDDARLDSFRNADPILREFGLKATMFAPLSNVEPDLPGFSSWEELKEFQSSGRWEIQAHGDMGHTFIKKDADGRTARFLTNRLWLKAEERLETETEWAKRVTVDHESSKSKILSHLGETPVAFAFPEGEYGQVEAPNLPNSAPLGLDLCRKSYAVCFQQSPRGLNVRSMDPARAVRVEPRRDWTGERLVRLIRDQTPFVRMRRTMLLRAAWSGKTHEALRLLEENRRAGVSEALLLSDEAHIRSAAGDRAAALRLAQRALELEPSEENKKFVAELGAAPRREWHPEFVYSDDNQGRVNRVFRQTLGPWCALGGLATPSHFHGSYSERGVETVSDDGAGVEWSRLALPDHETGVRLEGHFLGASAVNTFTALGSVRSRWTDTLQTAVEAGHEPYMNARALLAGVRERMISVSGVHGATDAVQVSARGKLASLTDGNARYTAAASVSAPVGFEGLRVVGQFLTDGIRNVSANYYSPLHLRTYSAGVSYTDKPLPWLTTSLTYLPGIADEGGSTQSFSQEVDAYASLQRGDFTLRPSISFSRTPVYRSTSYGGGLGWKF
jgi:tetratricopeptide (TPR) repeat protein